MRDMRLRTFLFVCLAAFVLLTSTAVSSHAIGVGTFRVFQVTPLVSSIPGAAAFQDSDLINPWGMFQGTQGELWVANNGTGTARDFDLTGEPIGIEVTIPALFVEEASPPTGAVFNPTNGFLIEQDGFVAPARGIFATEEGTIAGYNPAVNLTEAILEVIGMYDSESSPVFKGLAMAKDSTGASFLYATDFRNNQVDVFDSDWNFVGGFTDFGLPAGYAPFGIHTINNRLWVTFALQGPGGHDDVPGIGHGFVDIFEPDGTLFARFAAGGTLNSPWGVAEAPAAFTGIPKAALIGNFGDGRINVYDSAGFFLGQLGSEFGGAVTIPGLWSIMFLQRPELTHLPSLFDVRHPSLFFTAGGEFEDEGLVGKITPVFRRFTFADSFGTAFRRR